MTTNTSMLSPRRRKMTYALILCGCILTFSMVRFIQSDRKLESVESHQDRSAVILNDTPSDKTSLISSSTNASNDREAIPLSRIPNSYGPGERPAWVVLITVNDGFFDFLLNWLAHYQKLGVTRDDVGIVIVAYDDEVVEKMQTQLEPLGLLPPRTIIVPSSQAVHSHSSSEAADYDSEEFKKLMSNRATIVLGQLREGSGVILTDLDIVWVKDPFPYMIDQLGAKPREDGSPYDILAQVERSAESRQVQAASPDRTFTDDYCAGLFSAAHNDRVIQFMENWETELVKEPTHNQPLFNKLILDPGIYDHRLDIDLFQNGHYYFDINADYPEKQAKAAAIHNNFIRGNDRKKSRFIENGLWLVDA